MIEIVNLLEEKNPLFVSVSDLPCLNVRTVIAIKNAYFNSGRDACSTWIPVKRWKSRRENIPYREWIDGIEAFPAGINILRGDRIADPQDEYKILSDDPCLALNVNTRADLSEAELFMKCQDS
jgi:adenosylcobinamide-phosphate guanylyltransferase